MPVLARPASSRYDERDCSPREEVTGLKTAVVTQVPHRNSQQSSEEEEKEMGKNRLFFAVSLLVAAAMILGACAQATPTAAPTQAPPTAPPPTAPPPPTAEPKPAVGSAEHPIKVLFVPSVDAQVILLGGENQKTTPEEATGLPFEVSVPTSYAATIEEMCASPTDTMGFIPGLGYALASQLCGVDVSFKAVRFCFDVYWAQFLVPRDSDITSIEDLDGLKWGYGDPGSTSGYMVQLVMLEEAGVTPGEQVQTGGHNQSAQAPDHREGCF